MISIGAKRKHLGHFEDEHAAGAAYAAACQHLGEVAVVEAVGIAGYYSLVALTLGAFGVGEEDA